MARWEQYHRELADLESEGFLQRMQIPADCTHNAHMYYIILKSQEVRAQLIAHLKQAGITAVFHYIPLHSAKAGIKFGRFHGEDRYTTDLSDRLLRLPLYQSLSEEECARVITEVHNFFHK